MAPEAANLVDLVVHELRTPLAVALGSLRQLSVPDSPAQQAALARAIRSCERVQQLAADMRTWLHLQTSPPQTGTVTLRSTLAQAVVAASAARADVTVAPGEPPEVAVRALPALLADAVASLLVAVARAADPGEVVTVKTARAGDRVTIVMGRTADGHADASDTFDAQWLGGLGFTLPLAHAVVAGGGGDVRSTQSPDGRLTSISIHLAVAVPDRPR